MRFLIRSSHHSQSCQARNIIQYPALHHGLRRISCIHDSMASIAMSSSGYDIRGRTNSWFALVYWYQISGIEVQ